MNILVLGGLFLVGLAAIVVVVLLIMGEDRSENSAAAPVQAMAMPAPVTANAGASTKRLTVPLYEPESAPEHTKNAMSSDQSLPAMPARSLPFAGEEESYSALLNGQFHELAAELHSLHARAGEVEQRLSVLIEMMDRLEHNQDPGIDIDIDGTLGENDVPPMR